MSARATLATARRVLLQLRLRATLVGSQLVGLAVSRYVLRLEPLASTPADELARHLGPTLDRYLTGAL